MISAFSGFALIGVIVFMGWLVGRWVEFPVAALGRLVYLVLAPCLLFTVVAKADLGVLFSEPLLVSTAAACVCFALYPLIIRGRDKGTRIVGALAGGYTNANYIGLPIATYVLHDAALVVPIVILQVLVITPVALTMLEIVTVGRASVRSVLATPLQNPLIAAVILGALVAVTGVRLPTVVADPIATVGEAAVPVVLLVFGLSLHGQRLLAPGSDRVATIAAVVMKTAVMPAVAFGLASALRLPNHATYAVTVLAGLPTAQNVFLYAQRFSAGLVLIRDAIFLSTLACVPALLLIAYLFTRS
ncbi:AEC family transporter [Actinoplanes sp. TBRC 11911]|uniref:AEC family transporter n=1 Tax=Actinoplanes sp. TBRC 11911 TaxID=2729386 RepID=UPI00145D3739|nr:AEC family transporter [Actinoplanes sp. TBRC 11911]NMO52278.1 AEC family transporter [Actinoplanes sp. TBRC 11911]